MCGLAAILAYGNRAPHLDPDELIRIRDHMAARGPDGAGLWVSPDRRIGLAHRRLSILDVSDAGAQPMLDPETGDRIVFNGEIYNYRALRADLERLGHQFRSRSDTEVLLKLYAEYGRDLVYRLRGMYAFAIWDDRRRGLLLVRDPLGIKPLYYADDGSTVRVASQVKALLAGGQVDTSPAPAGHVGFFLWGNVPEPYTLYRGIRALPAGTSYWVDSSGYIDEKRYFCVADAFTACLDVSRTSHGDEAQERLRAALLDSVACHLVADVPVGIFLSAGLDSTTLTYLAGECSGQPQRTVTLGFTDFRNTANDEVPLANLVARECGSAHSVRWITKSDFADRFDHFIRAMDQPSVDGINTYLVSLAAKECGLKVAFSGVGGDELFGGYSSFKDIPRLVGSLGFLSSIPFLGRGFRVVSAPLLRRLASPKYAGLLELGGDYASAYLLRRGLFMPWELSNILDPDLARRGWCDLQMLDALKTTTANIEAPRHRVGALEMAWYLRNQLLRDADWAGMAHSVEVRVPFVDLELILAVAGLARSGWCAQKRNMAAAARPELPDAVLKRGKTGFSVPMKEWLSTDVERTPTRVESAYRRWAAKVYWKSVGAIASRCAPGA